MQEYGVSSQGHRDRKNPPLHPGWGSGEGDPDLYLGVLATLERTLTPLRTRQGAKASGPRRPRSKLPAKAD